MAKMLLSRTCRILEVAKCCVVFESVAHISKLLLTYVNSIILGQTHANLRL